MSSGSKQASENPSSTSAGIDGSADSAAAKSAGAKSAAAGNSKASPWWISPPLVIAVAIVALFWSVRLFGDVVLSGTPGQFMIMVFAPLVTSLLLLIWWLGLSRMPWIDRIWGPASLILGGVIAGQLADKSMQLGMVIFAIPVVLTAVVAWLVITSARSSWMHRAGITLVCLVTWNYFTLLRVDGIDGSMAVSQSWRWEPTAEDEFLAQKSVTTAPAKTEAAAEPLVATDADWTEFRGKNRISSITGVNLARDWKTTPPKEIWRRRVGPGWGSFAVVGDHVFTQDQRGENEAIVCFSLATGDERWIYEHPARFWEVVAGAGPRATPTFFAGRLYTLGGSGKLHCLDAASGEMIWARDIAIDADAKPPEWGFSSSPLVTDELVCVFAGGEGAKELLAYDRMSGELRWSAGDGKLSYSSPQLITIAGKEQLLFASNLGLEAFSLADGKPLWKHDWKIEGMARVVQPQVLDGSKLLLGTGYGYGTMLLEVAAEGEQFATKELWLSKEMKPYFNDFVIHREHLFGFDGAIFGCVDLADGKRAWKKGRYGHGQVLLLADQSLLVVISETGELVLLEANPEKFVELAKLQVLDGKTWNHPVIVGRQLLVRNGAEVACYELPVEGAAASPTAGP